MAAGWYWWGIFTVYTGLSDGFTDISDIWVHGYMRARLIGHSIAMDNEV